ncbi:putative membrane-bound dehydrogenase-like protein [Catalinimonas alkaloidigena]|uniref:PVC-type heme-binding CxxCH protein n=1 Tax=Catalinimonas alkaloidigena TaxID=1075417 RepID=UPI002404E25C|nr:PVC-type heme-binding CxxCH protein [Catalinimonas alkaloidigena]MDF9797165.1 putative membrane-bound dehydrogenase-like protein [Catalinimonas alkaloidigena]
MKRRTLFSVIITILGISIIFFSFISSGSISLFDEHKTMPIPDSVLFHAAPVLSPEEALQSFQLEDGFRLELVASEPLIQDPVAMTFDSKGRIWVAEMQSYMPDVEGNGEDQPTGRIVILEDTDDDGRMDQSKVFLDGLVLPRVIRMVDNGIVYAEPPNLWFVENNNDKAGKKVLIDSVYAVGGNVEHQPNGMLRAMDNWYYNAKSRARYRYDAQSKVWEKQETEFRGQWGIAQDDYGRLFYNTNSNQLRGDLVPPNMMNRNPHMNPEQSVNVEIASDQKVYPIRPNRGINRGYKDEMLDEQGRLTRFTAASGPVIYRGDQFPEEYHANAFVPEPSGNLVKRNILAEEGAYISAKPAYEGKEFLASTDERFRPVSMYNGPDGNLYLVDMYRGIIQHETYVTDYLREQILSRGLEKPIGLGRIYRIVHEKSWFDEFVDVFEGNENTDLNQVSDEELLEYLSHPNGWWRDEAQRLLVERKAAVIPQLKALVKEGNAVTQMHALWSLEGLQQTHPEIIKLGLQSEDIKVKTTAIRIGERNVHTPFADETLRIYKGLAAHDSQQIQLQLALSLGEYLQYDSPTVLPLLRDIALTYGEDPLIREALVSSTYGKEKEYQAMIAKSNSDDNEILNALGEVIANAELSRQMKGKAFSKSEKEQFVLGKSLYEHTCSGCHQENGKGVTPIAPPLDGSEWVTGSEERLILVALHGLQGPVTVKGKVYQEPMVQPIMPGLKANPEFTDKKLAAVLTYIRNSWSNAADPVKPGTVKKLREQTIGRKDPYTEQEFIP